MAADSLNRVRNDLHVDDAGAEEPHRLQHFRPAVGVGADLDEDQLALHGLRRLELDDLEDVNELIELLGDLLQGVLVAVHHDRHAGDFLVLGRPDREGVDVEAPAGEQARDPDEDARLVLHENGQRVRRHSSAPPSQSGAMSRANLMSSLLVPAATIGHTMASLWTTKSITTGWSLMAMACSITASTSSLRSHRKPMHP